MSRTCYQLCQIESEGKLPTGDGRVFNHLDKALEAVKGLSSKEEYLRKVVGEFEIPEEYNAGFMPGALDPFLTAIHIRGVRIPKEDFLNPSASHLRALEASPASKTSLSLDTSPMDYLNEIPAPLRFLLYMDYRLFWEHFEVNKDYDDRELGCTINLLQGIEWVVKRLDNNDDLSLNDFCELHTIIAQNTNKISKQLEPGKYRKEYNALPLNKEAVSKAGLKEILTRIQSDKNADGFAVGYDEEFKIYGLFFSIIRPKLRRWFMDTTLEKMRLDVEEAKTETYKILCDRYPGFDQICSEEACTKIINQHLNLQGLYFRDGRMTTTMHWQTCAEEFQDLLTPLPFEEEFKLQIQYSRMGAVRASATDSLLANISNLSDNELDEATDELYDEINTYKSIALFPPSPELACEWAENAIERFNQEIKTLKRQDQAEEVPPEKIISAITDLITEIEQLHLFRDVNLRNCYLMLNFLLLREGFKWSVLYNPFNIGGLSRKECTEEVIRGIQRGQYIIDNAKDLQERVQAIETMSAVKNTPNYSFFAPEPRDSATARPNLTESYEKANTALTDFLQGRIEPQQGKTSSKSSD